MAQTHDLVSATGASFQNSSGYFSYSVGEPVISTLSSTGAILTQGFHQAQVKAGVPVISQAEIKMTVFPNPVREFTEGKAMFLNQS